METTSPRLPDEAFTRYCVRHENTNNPPITQEVMRHLMKLRTPEIDDTSRPGRHGIGLVR
jgi:hypothetical protein